MHYIYFLIGVVLFSTACTKEEGYGRFNLKDGQEVELFVNHRYGSIADVPLLSPHKESPELPLSGFDQREAGYNYRVKAKMVAYRGPVVMDGGPGHALRFIEVIRKEKYEGDESFELSLVRSVVPGPPMIYLRKEDDKYFYILDEKTEIQLNFVDQEVADRLAEIWEFNEGNFRYGNSDPTESKWRVIRATVTHDSANFGKAYLVSKIEMQEK